MLGAGVFFVWAPAAAAAGSSLLISLLIAAVIAALNAFSSAQLAMAHPVSGGAYAFARATIGPWTGFAAGWLFLAGKTASCAAIALIAGSYLWPEHARVIAVAAIIVFAGLNISGIRTTAVVTTAIVAVVITGLGIIAAGGLVTEPATSPIEFNGGVAGILQAAGLLFFAFAGYARMATLGEEVIDARRNLPRAILIALGIALVIYGSIGVLLVSRLGTDALATTDSPLAALFGTDVAVTTVAIVAAVACFGSLIGILAGLSRTSLAMARHRDLPAYLDRISVRTNTPVAAEITIAIIAVLAVVFLDPTALVGFSSCAVLIYYAIAHASAFRQPAGERWLHRWVQVGGILGCLLLAFTLPLPGVLATLAWLLVGLALRKFRQNTKSALP